ncbi:unnamed protein product [Clonostachys solani]|uniref:Uncharacterized protein n=1 Tax=Clonostachys solani TaxID=160281 RepID=A0A9N9Z0Q7_9HYPO|nr:unnamed protein product [Clonostachys solani]
MSQSNSPLPHFDEHVDHISTFGAGDQFALSPLPPSRHNLPSPSHQDPPNQLMSALPSEEGVARNGKLLTSDRDTFESNQFDNDPILLRGSGLWDGADHQFQPHELQRPRAVSVEGNIVRGTTVLIVGHQTSKDLRSKWLK